MKIALLGSRGIPPCYGGTETYVEYLSLHLAAKGDDVIVYCQKLSGQERQQALQKTYPKNIRRIEIPSIPSKHLDNLIRSLISVIHVSFNPDIDIVQINNPGPCLFSFIPRLMGKKVVGAMRALDSQREKWDKFSSSLLRFGELCSIRFAHVTTVNSLAMKRYFTRTYQAQTAYIPNGVDLPRVLPEPDQITKWGLGKQDYLLFMARLEPEKGCHTLVQAFEKIKDTPEAKGLKLAIAGHKGKSPDYYNQLVEQAGDERIKLLGFASGRLKDELFANAFAFILPSSIEGMSNSLLSAMAYGLPSIVSDIPENVAVFETQSTDRTAPDPPGMVFRLWDADDLAEKLMQLVSDRLKARDEGQRLRQHACQYFQLENMGKNTRKVYEQIIKNRSPFTG